VFREVASGAKTDRAQLRRVLAQLDTGDVLMVTRDTWADTTTSHGRLMLTVLGGLA
jgi:DNA invertase Pin-like site-specific DNA recombinase